MLKLFSYSLLFLVCFSSCNKEKEIEIIQPQVPLVDPNTAFLSTIQCGSLSPTDYYISGEFNGNSLFCTTSKGYSQASFYSYNLPQGVDYGSLMTATPQADLEIGMVFTNTQLFQKTLPASWPHANPAYCESITIKLRQPGAKDGAYFYDSAWKANSIKVTVTSVANDIVEGTFEGPLHHMVNNCGTGSKIIVKNGKFRVKVRRQL
jgi:hypothetical protein